MLTSKSFDPVVVDLDGYVLIKKDVWEEVSEEIEANNPHFLQSLKKDFEGERKDWRSVRDNIKK